MTNNLKPLIYTLALGAMAFASCKKAPPAKDKLLEQTSNVSVWTNNIISNTDTAAVNPQDTLAIRATAAQKDSVVTDLLGSDFELTSNVKNVKGYPKGTQQIKGKYVKGTRTIAKVLSTNLVGILSKEDKKNGIVERDYNTRIIMFANNEETPGFIFVKTTVNEFDQNDHLTKTKVNYSNGRP